MSDIDPEIKIEILHRDGTETFDPNGIIAAVMDGPPDWPSTPTPSAISGSPAVIYKTIDVEVPLTSAEVYRLIMKSLQPVEYFALRAAVGDIFEIHDDFYDPATGSALDPWV